MPRHTKLRAQEEIKEELLALIEMHEETRLMILTRLSQLPEEFNCHSHPWLAKLQFIGGPAVSLNGKQDP